MAVTQYIGARYVPLFADPVEWSSTKQYEPLTIVMYQGNSFTSKQFVPIGVDINDTKYWAETGNYNAQVEQYRQEVNDFSETIVAKSFAFDTVTDMSRYDNLYVGAICHTSGFHVSGDGGGALYIITENATANGINVIECGSYYAVLVESTKKNVRQFGAYGDGSHDDTEVFDYVMNNYDNIYIPKGTYLVTTKDYNLIGKNIFGDGDRTSIIKFSYSSILSFGTVLRSTHIHSIGFDLSLVSHKVYALQVGFSTGTAEIIRYHKIENIYISGRQDFACGILFNVKLTGLVGGYISNVDIVNCYDGIYIDGTDDGTNYLWLSGQTFNNIYIQNPTHYGFAILANTEGTRAFGIVGSYFNNITVQARYGSATCFIIPITGNHEFNNCVSFNDTGEDEDCIGLSLYSPFSNALIMQNWRVVFNSCQFEGRFVGIEKLPLCELNHTLIVNEEDTTARLKLYEYNNVVNRNSTYVKPSNFREICVQIPVSSLPNATLPASNTRIDFNDYGADINASTEQLILVEPQLYGLGFSASFKTGIISTSAIYIYPSEALSGGTIFFKLTVNAR